MFPDYQGVGIGRNFTNEIAEMYKKAGKNYCSTTSNPSMINARKKDKKWITVRIGRAGRGSQDGAIQNKHKKGSTSADRITVGFEYIGD